MGTYSHAPFFDTYSVKHKMGTYRTRVNDMNGPNVVGHPLVKIGPFYPWGKIGVKRVCKVLKLW